MPLQYKVFVSRGMKENSRNLDLENAIDCKGMNDDCGRRLAERRRRRIQVAYLIVGSLRHLMTLVTNVAPQHDFQGFARFPRTVEAVVFRVMQNTEYENDVRPDPGPHNAVAAIYF